MNPLPLRILLATSEALPFIKTGGLADVCGALPLALRDRGVDCRLLLPGYPAVMARLEDAQVVTKVAGQFSNLLGDTSATLLQGVIPGSDIPVYVLDIPSAYQRLGGPYQDEQGLDHADNAERFALLSKAAALLASDQTPLTWRPDILHCNDWQTGLAPAYLHFMSSGAPTRTPTLMTIHNLAYQGIFPPETLTALELPPESFSIEGVEYYGNLSFLKAGLYYADRLITVSPSYAEEIQHAPLGMGLQGLLTSRQEQLTGILNGIDTGDWNPSSDLHLPGSYSVRAPAGKRLCKRALQTELGLDADDTAPLFGVIARMTPQKGLDLILEVADDLIQRGGQLVMLGTGDKEIELAVRAAAARHPGRVACFIGYDEALSHRIEAASDIFLMPSRFEPCGLNQMYSLRYGAVPIVHATGGLRDTVDDNITGFLFDEPTALALWPAVERALARYADKPAWKRMMLTGMKRDFSWENSAREYAALYDAILAG